MSSPVLTLHLAAPLSVNFASAADAAKLLDALRAAMPAQPNLATPSPTTPDAHERSRIADIVFDPATGLQWSARPIGTKRLTFAEAQQACAELRLGGHSDWRLPTRDELYGIVDYNRFNPAIDPALFPDTPSEAFWSSSPDASDPSDFAWVVYFNYGHVSLYYLDTNAWVRAVRSAAPARQ